MLHAVHYPRRLLEFPAHGLATLHTVDVESMELALSMVCCEFPQSALRGLLQLWTNGNRAETGET